MASFKAKFPVLQELFAKNHRGGQRAPPVVFPTGGGGRGLSASFSRNIYLQYVYEKLHEQKKQITALRQSHRYTHRLVYFSLRCSVEGHG